MDLKQDWGPLAGWSEGGGIHVSVLTENIEKHRKWMPQHLGSCSFHCPGNNHSNYS